MVKTKQLVPTHEAENPSAADLGVKSPSLGLAVRGAAPAASSRPNEGGNQVPQHPGTVDQSEGGNAAHRLDNRTHLDSAQFRVCLKNYGGGLGEIGWSFIASRDSKQKLGRGTALDRESNEDRCIRRARSRIRQLVLSARADHLLTLTYRENVTDFQKADSDLKKFARLMKKEYPTWVYIAVPENQKRGAWHWHLAVVGRQDVNLIRSLWRQVVGEGNIDVKPPKGKAKHRRLALVKYLGKYLSKSFTEGKRELNARRFRSSLGIYVPMEYLTVPDDALRDVPGYALNQLKTATGSIGYVWEKPEEITAGWACSWS